MKVCNIQTVSLQICAYVKPMYILIYLCHLYLRVCFMSVRKCVTSSRIVNLCFLEVLNFASLTHKEFHLSTYWFTFIVWSSTNFYTFSSFYVSITIRYQGFDFYWR